MLTTEQKKWLKDNFGIDVDKLSKGLFSTTRKVGEEYIEFYTQKEIVLKAIDELIIYPIAQPMAQVLRQEVQSIESRMLNNGKKLGGDKEEFHKELKTDLKSLKEQEGRAVETNQKVTEFNRVRARVHENLIQIRNASNKFGSDIKTIESNLNAATNKFRSNDFGGAIEVVRGCENSSKELLKSAESHLKEKQKFLERFTPAEQNLKILKATPHCDPSTLEGMVLSAALSAKALDFKTAYEELKDHEKAFTNAREAARKEQDRIHKNEAASDPVIKSLGELDSLFEAVSALPGISGWINEQQNALLPIRNKATNGDYAEAWSKLTDSSWKIDELRKKAQELSTKAVEKGKDDYENVDLSYQICKTAIDKLKELATDQEFETLMHEVNQYFDAFLQVVGKKGGDKNEKDKAATTCENALVNLRGDLEKRIVELNKARDTCVNFNNNIVNGISDLRSLIPMEELAVYELQFKQLQGAFAIRDFEKIQTGLDSLASELQKAVVDGTESKEDWLSRFKSESKEIEESLQAIKDCSATAAREAYFRQQWDELKGLASSRYYANAVDQLDALKLEMQPALQAANDRKLHGDKIDQLNLQFTNLLNGLDSSIKELKTKISDNRNGGDSSKDAIETPIEVEGKATDLRTRWQSAVLAATDTDSLGYDSFNKEYEELASLVESIQGDPLAIDDIINRQLADEQKAEFDLFADEAYKAIESLLELDSSHGLRMQKIVNTISSKAPKNYLTATEQMEQAVTEINAAISIRGQLVQQLRSTINTAYTTANSKITEAKNLLSRDAKTKFEAYFASVLAAVEDMNKASLATSNVGALYAALDFFTQTSKDMESFKTELSKNNNVFQTVLQKLTDLEGVSFVGNANLAKCLPTKQKMLDEKLKELQVSVMSVAPNVAMERLVAFEKEVSELVVQANFAQSIRDTFQRNKKTALLKLQALPKQLEYRGSLQAKVEGLEAKVNSEGKEEAAANELAGLIVEIDQALNQPDFRNQKNKEVIDARLETEKKKLQWESQLSLFNTKFELAKTALKAPEADQSQRRELEKMRDEAKKNAKSQNYDLAIKQIAMAIKHAELVTANPLGEKVTSRNNLPKDQERYQNAVRSLADSLRTIADKINEEVGKSVDSEVAKSAASMLKLLEYQFDLSAFSTEVGILSQKGGEINQRRAAKEKALGQVRAYQKILDGDPMLMQILINPFSLDSRAALDAIRIALNSLDVNLRRCI